MYMSSQMERSKHGKDDYCRGIDNDDNLIGVQQHVTGFLSMEIYCVLKAEEKSCTGCHKWKEANMERVIIAMR